MKNPRLLPVWESRNLILSALEKNNVIIVESPTGSGKTTQIPLILKEAHYAEKGIIGITQPRRIATLSVCSFIQEQIKDENLSPSFCGYKMRFFDTTDESTRIKILTDGMLLQELKADPALSKYSVIMVDEAHERSLNIDFILGLLKQILQVRKDLKVIISSATINTKIFASFFKNELGIDMPIVSIESKIYNVDIKYYHLEKKQDTEEISHSICQIINYLLKRFKQTSYIENKDTLVFLPGESDIKTVLADLYANCDYRHLQVYPLYGRMNKEEQERVFEKTQMGKMKVVLATNIAETSLTIDGIKTVIDSGLSKVNYYNQYDFTSSLVTKPVSKSSAMQRTGRAGRTSDGVCYRLYSQEDFNNRPLYPQEEILRKDLSEVVLRMVDLGITNFESFPFITRPSKEAIASGERTLKLLQAIDENRHLTPVGEIMVKYPLLPRHSRCLVYAMKNDPEIISNICVCISFLSCKTPFVLPSGEEDYARTCHKKFSTEFGDFLGYQVLYDKYRKIEKTDKREEFCHSYYLDFQSMEEIMHVTKQLCDITSEMGIAVNDFELHVNEEFSKRCLECLCSGLLQNICYKTKGSTYRTLTADEIYIHPGSAWFRTMPEYLLAGEIVLTTKMYARTVSPLKREWIQDMYPEIEKQIKKHPQVKTGAKLKQDTKKTLELFGNTYPVITTGGKKENKIAVIPYTDLVSLYRTYRKSRRTPKNVHAVIKFKNYYISYGEKLYDILSLANRLSFDESSLNAKLPADVFYPDTIKEIIPYLGHLIKLKPLTKYKDRLGFTELVTSKNGIFFHVNSSFTEAIMNTSYSLLTIIDSDDNKSFKNAYNRIVKLID